MARFAKNKRIGINPESAVIPIGTTAQRPASPRTGASRFNTSLTSYEVYDGSNWRQFAAQGVATLTIEDLYTGTPSQTIFTMSLSVPGDLANNILVFVAGVYQNPLTAYTVSSTTLTFVSAPPSTASDRIIVIHGINSTAVV